MPLPSFKDILARDTASVFLNEEEFADGHTLNGKAMPCLIDNNELLERQKGGGGTDRKDGLFSADILLFVKADDFGPRPVAAAVVVLDGRPYRVKSCPDEAGIYSMTLEATQGW